ncbi:MAG: isoaspartyl peptidase/L-asparaginase [Cyclobacteriaceae bacterium]
MKKIAIAIHGGAGTLLKKNMTPEMERSYTTALEKALTAGHLVLENEGDAVSAVEEAVKQLEDSPLFNAGKGSVFTSEGTHEMDASIMDGKTLNAGALSMVRGVRNPVSLARLIMEKSGHVFLAGEGAAAFARQMNCSFEPDEYFFDELRFQQWQQVKGTDNVKLDHSVLDEKKFGTVGAVALDMAGNVAAATSTGGMTNKKFGRVGDSPMIGAGNYANNLTCAVSCTGSGEFFIRGVVAYDVSCLMEYKGLSLQEAADHVINHRLKKIGGDGGLIAIDAEGNIAMPFNTDGMYRASWNANNEKLIAIYR